LVLCVCECVCVCVCLCVCVCVCECVCVTVDPPISSSPCIKKTRRGEKPHGHSSLLNAIHTRPHTHTLSHTQTHTHTHTYTLSHTHTHTHTHTHGSADSGCVRTHTKYLITIKQVINACRHHIICIETLSRKTFL